MEIKILGTGCNKCKKLEQMTRMTVEELGLQANVEKVEDIYKIMQYGVMKTPGLVIDEKVVLSGRLPRSSELIDLISRMPANG